VNSLLRANWNEKWYLLLDKWSASILLAGRLEAGAPL
jgi:hypothetical protein